MPQAPQSINPSTPKLHKLSESDISRLLSPEHETDARLDITSKLSENYQSSLLRVEDAQIAEQIFRLLVRDTELSIRMRLSETLKTSNALPRDIALTMAADVVEVALPMLQSSSVLSEKDLIDIVNASPDSSRHIAIAKRKAVPEKLVDVLLEFNNEAELAHALASNEGAALNEQSMHVIIDRHKNMPQVMDVLATRQTLPASIAEKVIAHVSEQLRVHVAKTYQVGAEVLAEPTKQSREGATLALIRDNISDVEMEKLVHQLITFDRLTPSLLIAALAQGYVSFYVVSLAVLANIPFENVNTLIRDKGGLGFRALYNKTGLPLEYLATMRDLVPHAFHLKEDMAALEGKQFSEVLVKRLRMAGKQEGVSFEHLIKVIDAAGQ